MGQNQSYNQKDIQETFSLKCHDQRCTIRKAVEENDFFIFQSELNANLDSMGISTVRLHQPSEYVATITSDRCDMGFLGENVKLYAFNRRISSSFLETGTHHSACKRKILTSKVKKKDISKVMLYIPCNCQGRYAGMDINSFDRTGRTALNVAIRKRDSILVRLYLHCGVDPNMWNKYGETPLHMASAMGFIKAAELLLENGADPNAVDHPPSNLLIQSKETPIIAAASHGHAMCIAELLKGEADPNLKDRDGNTALHKCSQYGYRSCVKILLKHKASVNLRNKDRITPLQLALIHMNSDIANILVNFGCDVTSYSEELLSILSLSAMSGELGIVRKCLKEGEYVDKLDKFNKTALYYTFTLDSYLFKKLPIFASHACRFDIHVQIPNRKQIVELLIKSGADVEIVLAEAVQSPRHILNKKHFSLPENIAIFQRMIQACGFNKLTLAEANDLFWHMMSANGKMLAKLLLFAMPKLDYIIKKKLGEALDWTGAHTEDAIYVFLEAAGSDLETSNWICKRTKQPRSLQEWSRDSIRTSISSNVNNNVIKLPIPPMLKDYICLRDVLTF